jgi:hypothetical protein
MHRVTYVSRVPPSGDKPIISSEKPTRAVIHKTPNRVIINLVRDTISKGTISTGEALPGTYSTDPKVIAAAVGDVIDNQLAFSVPWWQGYLDLAEAEPGSARFNELKRLKQAVYEYMLAYFDTGDGQEDERLRILPVGDVIYSQDFETYNDGDNPDDWLDTGANNSMFEDDSLFRVTDLNGNMVIGTSSTEVNIHSHYVGGGSDNWSNYRFSGRMLMTTADGGIGVTFYSKYTDDDTYYRLRRLTSTAFHLAPHPHGAATLEGTLNSGVVPLPNIWYRFIIEVENVDGRTDIRAMVWPVGDPQPADWQIVASDSSASHISAGRIGFWSFGRGSKYWDDLSVKSLAAGP